MEKEVLLIVWSKEKQLLIDIQPYFQFWWKKLTYFYLLSILKRITKLKYISINVAWTCEYHFELNYVFPFNLVLNQFDAISPP